MPGGDTPDSDLIVASWDQPQIFAEIFLRHYSAVFGFVGAALGVDVAADIASEVFLRAFEQRHRYRTEYRSARPWLMGIASNLVADHHRKHARERRAYRRAANREMAVDDFADEAAQRLHADALSSLLVEALSLLRTEEVSVVALFVLEQMTYKEIAQTLDIPEGTVRSRLSRARTRLRNLLEDPGEHHWGKCQ